MSPDLCQKRVRPIAYSCDHVLRSQVTLEVVTVVTYTHVIQDETSYPLDSYTVHNFYFYFTSLLKPNVPIKIAYNMCKRADLKS